MQNQQAVDITNMSVAELKALGFDQQISIRNAEQHVEQLKSSYDVILNQISIKLGQEEQERLENDPAYKAQRDKEIAAQAAANGDPNESVGPIDPNAPATPAKPKRVRPSRAKGKS